MPGLQLVRGQAFNEADRNYEAYSFEEKGQAETVGQTPRERDYTHTPVKQELVYAPSSRSTRTGAPPQWKTIRGRPA